MTSGLSVTAGTDWTLSSYRLRRSGNRVEGEVVATYTGATLTGSADEGNWGDLPEAITMPPGWRNGSGRSVTLLAVVSGVKTAFARANAGTGVIDFTHGTPGLVVSSGNLLRFQIDYTTD